MIKRFSVLVPKTVCILISVLITLTSCTTKNNKVYKYPYIKTVNVVVEYHGQKIVDPYRNMENLNDPTVISWLKAQKNLSDTILQKIPNIDRLIEKQKKFDQDKAYSIWSIRETYDGQFFYLKQLSGDSMPKLYYRQNLESPEIILYDSVEFSSNKDYYINYFKQDWRGEKVAIAVSKENEEISQIFVIDVISKKTYPSILKNCKPNIGGIQWLPDNSGFTYIYYPNTNPQKANYGLNTKSLLYRIGENPTIHNEIFSQSNNPEVNLNPEDFPKVYIYQDYYEYAFGQISGSSRFKDVYFKKVKNLELSNKPWKKLYTKSDKVEHLIPEGNNLFFLTAKNASNFKICKTSIKNPDFESPETIVPESDETVITDFEVNKNGLYYVRVKNGVSAKLYHYSNGKEQEIELPKPSGSVRVSSKGPKYSNLIVYTEGWLQEGTLYEYDHTTNQFIDQKIIPSFNHSEFQDLVVKEIEVKSHDGLMIPLSIIHKKNIPLDGSNPTLFTGYGSYGGSGSPFFSSNFLTWVSEGGILAIAHVRGGGEKGDTWYKGGFKTTKSNTWKDMISCTEYMIEKGYTNPKKSSLMGSSAGGIMAGKAMTDRPDLYNAVVLLSPAMNMLRSEIQPNGQNSIKEFGTVEKEEEFKALLEMDSYHSIKKETKYPATLVTAGLKDGRVVAWDSAKFVAKLQECNTANENPIVFSINFDAGHSGINMSMGGIYKLYADLFAFAFWQTGHPDYQPKE